jgi:hypothetical protein
MIRSRLELAIGSTMSFLDRLGVTTAWMAVLPLAVALNACAAREEKVQENVVPTDYKPPILEMLHGALEDPTNIRDASISDPVLKPVAGATRYMICIRYNPRDAGGRYTGIKTIAAVYYAGRLTQFINPSSDQCSGVTYHPFPELQKLCRTIVCQGDS